MPSSVARARCAAVVPRVIPVIDAARVLIPVRRAEPGERGHERHAVARGTLRASASMSAALLMMPSPSRSHCTAAPAMNALPSSA